MKLNSILFLSLSAAFLVAASPLSAAVFERDWKTPGDGLLTYDDVNNREWLDLTAQLGLPTPRYERVVGELGPGGMFEGFVVANRNEIVTLAESAGVIIGTSDFFTNGAPISRLIDLLGEISGSSAGFRTASGLLDEIDDRNGLRYAALFDYSEDRSAALHFVSRADGVSQTGLPVFLYRAVVPEPSSSIAGFSAIIILAWHRRNR